MKRVLLSGMVALAACISLAAQAPVAKPLKAKSKPEAEAVQAMLRAPDADSRINAANTLITKWADTEFKPLALYMITLSYQEKNDYEKTIAYGEQTLEANPKDYNTQLLLARVIASRTHEFDLDREEKLGKVEKYVKAAEDELKDAPKPNPNLPDEQWAAAKKEMSSQGHEALGMAAMARKKYDVAVTEYKSAVEIAPSPDPIVMVRLAQAYNLSGKPDEAIAVCEKVMAMPDVNGTIKGYAQAERVRATQRKAQGGGAPAAAAPSTTVTPGTVEIKKP